LALSKAVTFNNFILEDFEYRKELCPKIWDASTEAGGQFKIKPEIREKLMSIAKDFWSSLKLEVKVLDVQLTGSLANYNWTMASDLDVHIIIDFAEVNTDMELVRKALDGQRFVWNLRHPVVIKGHDVECYIQHKDAQHRASGLYSLLRDRWIVVPFYNPPKVDDRDVSEKTRVIVNEVKEVQKKAKAARGEEARELLDYLERFKAKIMADRKFGLYDTEAGEYSVENLVFKELRKNGTMEKIVDLASELYSKIYSE
jgi:predicted nucleotidyltransferase